MLKKTAELNFKDEIILNNEKLKKKLKNNMNFNSRNVESNK